MSRVGVVAAWSNSFDELVTIVYEDCDTGTIFIERVAGCKGTTVVTVEGEVSKLTNKEFRDVWLDGDYG